MDHFHARSRRRPAARAPAALERPAARATSAAGDRLDARLVALGLAASRSAAQRLITAGAVAVDGVVCTKASRLVSPDALITCQQRAQQRFVSRAGEKLDAALATLGWSVAGCVALDVGQSTGGFTDCLLQRGVRRVVGIEVGHDQIAPSLRAKTLRLAPGERPDPAQVATWPILLWEGVNARALTASALGPALPPAGFDLIVGDLSFISASLVWPAVLPLAAPHGRLLWLVKPQFELGASALDKHGVVRDLARYEPSLRAQTAAALQLLGWTMRSWFPSALPGGGVGNHPGNQEFFVAAVSSACKEQEPHGTLG